jgi:hypothetical protein
MVSGEYFSVRVLLQFCSTVIAKIDGSAKTAKKYPLNIGEKLLALRVRPQRFLGRINLGGNYACIGWQQRITTGPFPNRETAFVIGQ